MEKSKSRSATEEEEGGLDLTACRARLLKFYQDSFKCELYTDTSKMECTMTCLGQMYDDDAVKSVSEVCKFLKKIDVAETLALYTVTDCGHGFLDFARLVDRKLIFSIGSVINISKNFYLPAISKSKFIHKMWLGNIGNTSYESHTSTSSVHGQILLNCQNQGALVDNKTRRPTRLPDWWKNKYEKFVVGKKRYTFVKLDRPCDILSSDVLVVHNDRDENQHTNWLAYPMYCINSVNSYINQGHFKGKENICRNWIKRLEMLHLGESLEGDNLVVHIWKEDCVDNRIASHIYKGDKCIFQCIIDYHSSLATSQL
ncbi:hypothetical protein CHS0354_016494 [Potamilus streckersoni]|uniref:Uncharacterized protein n=1 Tax=Potamilus streckersoni TaxID=2493646 RepID=A0AAE0VW14_9BIVA|nr:hypothetical protein CHS0354_016494 [Potamilus streckersoni]